MFARTLRILPVVLLAAASRSKENGIHASFVHSGNVHLSDRIVPGQVILRIEKQLRGVVVRIENNRRKMQGPRIAPKWNQPKWDSLRTESQACSRQRAEYNERSMVPLTGR